MAQQEEQKFLDLDMVVKAIQNLDDRGLFQEAVNCYYAGSHRAAAILAWYAAANCLKRRIFELQQEGDGEAQKAATKLSPGEGQVGEEETLINCAKDCELIDDIEVKSLRFAREMRNKCAHPTGFVPSAEAIRHVLFICSQYVLCRKGYRGLSYIRSIVTSQFDDNNFLANSTMITVHCREITERVPRRLWPQFVKIAAEERGTSHTDIWRTNAYKFFEDLLTLSEGHLTDELAVSMQAFESKSPSFFAVLVGINGRVAQFWGHQKRSQIRNHLRNSSVTKVRADEVHAWATICAEDGFEDDDLSLLHSKFVVLSRFLATEEYLFEKRRKEILDAIESLIRDDNTSSTAAIGFRHLFPTSLFSHVNTVEMNLSVNNIVNEVIVRFVHDSKHHELIDRVKEWNSTLLIKLLESASRFLVECSEDNADDVALLFDARKELENRNPLAVPASFADTIKSILNGSLMSEWNSDESIVGQTFRSLLTPDELSERVITSKHPDQYEVLPEIDDFWYSRLGVRISPRQDQLLRLCSEDGGMSPTSLAHITGFTLEDINQDAAYLELQALLVRADDKYSLREDLHSFVVDAQSLPNRREAAR